MKLLSLFTGIGAFEKALKNQKIKYELVGFSEIDKYAVKSYCAIHNETEELNLGDVRNIHFVNAEGKIDMMTWGFPCQDISVAGRLKGVTEGTRSGLYYQGIRILNETKPKYSIIENVKNLTSKRFKETFEMILNDLENAGYNSYWKVLNAKNYGIPQNRERVFIVSIRKDIDDGTFQFPEPFESERRLKDVLENEVDQKYFLSEKMIQGFIANRTENNSGNIIEAGNLNNKGWYRSSNKVYSEKGIAPTITAMQGGNIKPKVAVERIGGIFDKDGKRHQAGSIYDKEGIAPAIDSMQGGYRQPMVDVINATKKGYDTAKEGDSINMSYPYSNKKRGRVGHGVAQTLDTTCRQATLVKTNKIMVEGNCFPSKHEAGRIVSENGISPTIKENHGTVTAVMKNTYPEYRIRRLTPIECWRLMGFDDTDFYKAKEIGMSDTQLYKQAGNSIVVNVLEEILKKLLKEDKQC